MATTAPPGGYATPGGYPPGGQPTSQQQSAMRMAMDPAAGCPRLPHILCIIGGILIIPGIIITAVMIGSDPFEFRAGPAGPFFLILGLFLLLSGGMTFLQRRRLRALQDAGVPMHLWGMGGYAPAYSHGMAVPPGGYAPPPPAGSYPMGPTVCAGATPNPYQQQYGSSYPPPPGQYAGTQPLPPGGYGTYPPLPEGQSYPAQPYPAQPGAPPSYETASMYAPPPPK